MGKSLSVTASAIFVSSGGDAWAAGLLTPGITPKQARTRSGALSLEGTCSGTPARRRSRRTHSRAGGAGARAQGYRTPGRGVGAPAGSDETFPRLDAGA